MCKKKDAIIKREGEFRERYEIKKHEHVYEKRRGENVEESHKLRNLS